MSCPFHIRCFRSLLAIVFIMVVMAPASAQCDASVPSLVVDLSASPSATFTSPLIVRNGYCCGNTGNDVCIRFEITLHPDAQGFNFEVCEGAVPGGSMYYQLDCGPQVQVGQPICLSGEGPHILTFCKPGNNANRYCITSLPAPAAGPAIAVSEGCTGTLTSNNYTPGTVQWTSVFPGAIGAYDNYLSCPTCESTNVTGQAGYPAYVDYQVCGLALSPCNTVSVCDTVRVTFYSTLVVDILPIQPTVCYGSAGTTITATASGGAPPYTYQWSNGATGTSNFVGPGTYTVTVSDMTQCPGAVSTVTVTEFVQPIQALAGDDIVVCDGDPVAQINAAVTGVSTGVWITGQGQFNPSNTALNVSYTPSATEVSNGFVDLVLMTTNNGTCPGDQDTVRVYFDPGISNGTVIGIDATCNGSANGSAAFSPAQPGFTYLWNDPAAQTGAIATGLAAGTYSVTAANPLGCSITLPVTIGQPAALAIASMDVIDESCAGVGDGSVTANVTGGTPPYNYTWNVPGNGPTVTGAAGNYSVSVTDANGCTAVQANASIGSLGQPNIADAGADLVACMGQYPIALQGAITNATGGQWSGGSGNFTGTGLNVEYQPTPAEIQSGSVDLLLTTTGNTTCPPGTDQVTIAFSNAFIAAQLEATDVSCAGGSDGTLEFSPSLPGHQYQWIGMPQQTSPVLLGRPAGTYTLVVTDELGCDSTFTATIDQPAPLIGTAAMVQPVSCFGYSDGSAGVQISGGTSPYIVQWPNGGTQQQAGDLPAGTHTVSITDSNGCTVEVPVTIGTPPGISLTASIPDTVCVNAPVVLSATPAGGTGTLQVQWAGIGNGTTVMHAFASSQMVTVSVTDANNCPGPVIQEQVEVLDLESAQLLTFGDTTVCPGGYSYLAAQLQGYPGSYDIFWPVSGASGSGPFMITINNDMIIPVIVSDQCGNSIGDSIHLNVQRPPDITLPPFLGQGCAPLTVQMPDDLTDDPVNYHWNFGNGTVSGQQAPTVIYNNPGTFAVTLTVTTPLGCSATTENAGQVIVHPQPPVSFTADPWITDIDHATIAFDGNITGNVNSMVWDFGDGSISNADDPDHTYTDVGTYEVSLEVEDGNGCKNAAFGQIEIKPVYDITVPNIFTPTINGGGSGIYDPHDLSNDVFYPFIRYVKDFRMRVFNRWGEVIFESEDLGYGWNGYYRDQLSPQDVYVYQLWVRFVDGEERNVLGDITLLR